MFDDTLTKLSNKNFDDMIYTRKFECPWGKIRLGGISWQGNEQRKSNRRRFRFLEELRRLQTGWEEHAPSPKPSTVRTMMNSSWQIEKSLALIEDAEGTRTPTEPFVSAREIYFHRGSSFKFKHPSFWREVLRRRARLTFYKYSNINCGHLLAMSAATTP